VSEIKYLPNARGAKGGDQKQAQPRYPVEDPNTLQSKATGRVLYALGEGPFQGIVGGYSDGAKNIFLNGTPLMNADGSLNFQGVTWDYRVGTPDQSWIEGFPAVENTHSSDVGLPTEIKRSTPAIRSINNANANAVRVVIAVSGMVDQDTKTGDAHGTRVEFVIRVRRQGRSGWEAEYHQEIVGKTTSAYEEQYRLPLPGDGPWDIMVERLSADSDRASLQNATTWSSYTEIIDRKLRYPNTALLGLTFDAQRFGNSMPTVSSRWDTWVVRVPHNYDPVNRTYTGIFNGSWKLAYTSNPAYLFYALLTHRAGCALPDNAVDKAAIYTCGRYCDELVPSGQKNSDGSDIMEPRFEAHFVINTRQEAYSVVNALASSFRAMAYWASGAVTVVQDAPKDPVFTVTASQVTGGFEFAGPAVRAIKTVALVSFQDPENLDEADLEVYEDPELIKRYGWEPESITAFACKSRGQARRLGRWFIETGKLGDTLTYKTSVDHIRAAPGDVVLMTERKIVGVDLGGRLVSADRSTARLDRSVTIEAGKGYTLHIQMPDGTVAKRTVSNRPGATTALSVSPALPMAPVPEATWVLEVSDLRPRQFRVVGISDDGDMQYTVAAVPHDPTIYARVELGLNIKLPPVSKLPNPGIVQPPSNVRVDRQYISTPTGWTTALEISWDPSPDPYIRSYTVRYRRNNGNFQAIENIAGATTTLYGESTGRFVIHVQAVNIAGVESRPAILDIDIPDNSPITLIRPTGLEIEGQGNDYEFRGRDPVFAWRGTAVRGAYDVGQEPAVGAGYLDAIFRDYEVRVYDLGGRLVFTDHTTLTRYAFTFDVNSQVSGGPHRAFRFEVLMRDRWGNYSLPAAIDVSNPAPAQVTGLVAEGGYGSIFLSFDKPTDLDYEGTIVWMSETGGFVPGPEFVAYDGPNNFIFLQAPIQVDRFLRVAAYDSFGRTGLNVSAELKVRTAGVTDSDTVPPTVPTGLALTDEMRMGPDGTKTFWLLASWNANAEGDFRSYGIEIAEEDGNFLHFETNVPRYEWQVQAGVRYRVRLAASDYAFNDSIFSQEISHIVGGDNEAPAAPTSLTPSAAFKTIWLQWPQHPDADFSHMEVFEATVNDRTQASYIGNAPGTTFTREDLPGGHQVYYWIRAVDRSRNKSEFFPASLTGGIGARTKKIEEADYQELSIGNAAIMNAAIDDAKISSLSASKILANTVLSSEVIVGSSGKTLGESVEGTSDPAAAINRGVTTIQPGKITLSGGTTLANVLYGPDMTKIHGGSIAARTITADKLTAGVGVEFVNIAFTPIRESGQVTWTAGTAIMPADGTGAVTTYSIIGGSLQWTSGVLFIYWTVGTGTISGTTDQAINGNPAVIVLGTYTGAERLFISYARTVIDGNGIRARTINADRIQANAITANELSTQRLITAAAQIDQGLINSAHIGQAQINTGHVNDLSVTKLTGGIINAQYIRVGDAIANYGHVNIESRDGNRFLSYVDGAGVERVKMGQSGATPNRVLDGLYVRDINGKNILTANGLGVEIAGTDQLVAGATYGMNFINSHTLGFSSVKGGNMHVTAHFSAILGSMGQPDEFDNPTPLYGGVSIRSVLNGAVVPNSQVVIGAVGGSTAMFTMSHVFPASANQGFTWQLQQSGVFGWEPWGGRCQIVAVEYKR
jgi:predicted phage tail protein